MKCKNFVGASIVLCSLWSLVFGHCQVKFKSGFGSIKGYGLLSTTPKGYPMCSFLGIPYAQAPVGILRFEPPQPLDLSRYSSSWSFISKTPDCIQNNVFTNKTTPQQEDCLYLNVYTKPTIGSGLKPVIFWIHGGSFQTNSAYSNGADQPDFLVDEEVIFVSFNYRVGALGFLYREGDDIIGNLGLRDQLEALRWVRMNIAAFGGNSQKVTLMGWGAGAASVAYHLQAPASRDLFHSAIMMSGSSLNPWAYERQPEVCVNNLCKTLNIPCSPGDLKVALKRLPAAVFSAVTLNFESKLSYFGELHPCFQPTVESNAYGTAMVQSTHQNLMSQPIQSDVPLMIGYTVAETWPYLKVNRESLLHEFNYTFTNSNNDIMTALRRYLIAGTRELGNPSKKLMVEANVIHGVKDFAEYYNTNADSKIFFYRFSYKSIDNDFGAFHGDDLSYIFATNLKTHEDEVVRMKLVRYITDFAKFGNPTPKLVDAITQRWVPYANSGLRMEISDDSKMVRDVKDDIYRRWEIILQCLEFNLCKKFFKLTSEW